MSAAPPHECTPEVTDPQRHDGLPIGAYGVIGDLRTAALVGTDASIDWFAPGALDAPPAFSALVDPAGGGSFTLAPAVPYRLQRRYLSRTAVLETTFTTETGSVSVTDSLNVAPTGLLPWTELARRVCALEGEVPMTWRVEPGRRLANDRPWIHRRDGVPFALVGDDLLAVVCDGVGDASLDGCAVHGAFVARPGHDALVALVASSAEPLRVPSPAEIVHRAELTAETWRAWSDTVDYGGAWPDAVARSAICLRLLIAEKTGAMAAAVTTSLPEKAGGKRNFDYRYAWIRDASFSLDALGTLGLLEEVHQVLCWLLDAVSKTSPDLHAFYTLTGEAAQPTMSTVPGAAGWRSSTPVHVGNSAATQTQLGCYGDLIDAVYQYSLHGGHLDAASAAMVAALADRCCDLWQQADSGFWELGDLQQYTISKIGCWVALDRANLLVAAGQLSSGHAPRWRSEADAIHAWTDEHCWSATKRSYTFYAGTDDLDAAVLLAARTGFLTPDDPRLASTIDAVRTELSTGGPLLYRYSGQQDQEGAFVACSGWMIEALATVGEVEEARRLLDDLLELGSDLGLYSEEMDPATGELLGNTPQALSHLAVIGAATATDHAIARAAAWAKKRSAELSTGSDPHHDRTND